jgi:uncharacterized protein YggE
MTTIRIALAALLVLAVGALAGIGRPEVAGGAGEEERDGITVTGVGRIDAAPDQAEFSLGITTKAATAREALAANSDRMRRLIDALKAAGVAERDLKTQNVSIGPNYDGAPEPAGYSASNTVSVVIRDLDRAGAVLEAASRAGANNVYGPSLTRADRESLEAQALEKAVESARKRAEALARAADVRLGPVTAIVEAVERGGYELFAARTASDSPADVPIEKGTEEIAAGVTVTFAID